MNLGYFMFLKFEAFGQSTLPIVRTVQIQKNETYLHYFTRISVGCR